jgi:2-aminophenol/2-amino-5-chlorophenol 1,6-dioxygenase alpha subunit
MPGVIHSAYWVPGLPHLTADLPGNPWADLKAAYTEAGRRIQAAQPDVLVVYSAQWISVLGHSFQADPHPTGCHVDENWYEWGEFPFSLTVDVDLTRQAAALTEAQGLATKQVAYEGFPIDTGTLVAMRYVNPAQSIPVVIVSSNIYCSREDSITLGQAVGEAVRQSGKRAVFLTCSALSNRFLTEPIDPAADRLASDQEDQWNRRMLALMQAGQNQQAVDRGPEFAQAANAEMQFKGFYWLMGALGTPSVPAELLGYGPLWGTGAAVLSYQLN